MNVDLVPFIRGVRVLCKPRHILPMCSQDKSRDDSTYGYCHNSFYLFFYISSYSLFSPFPSYRSFGEERGGGGVGVVFALKQWMFS